MILTNMIQDLERKETKKESLKDMIREFFFEERDEPYLTRDRWIRCSKLGYLCPREEAIASIHKIIRKDEANTDLSLVFATGTALHECLQNLILPKINVLLGEWVCLGCREIFGGLQDNKPIWECLVPRPKQCDCGSSEFRYKEQFFLDEEYRIGGHPDGFLQLPDKEGIGLLEIKSVSPEGSFTARRAPFKKHILQVQTYLWLTGLPWASILYWNKGENSINCFIEHEILRDEQIIDTIKETAREIWDAIDSRILPEREICATINSPRARTCQVRDICFGVKK